MNRVQLIGNLGVEPSLRYTGTGKAVANFTLATNRYFKDEKGEGQQRTEWHRIVVWGRAAEVCAEFLKKGQRVFLEGSLRTRQWEDKDKVKRYTTEVYTNYVDFLGGGKQEQGKKQQTRGANEDNTGSDDSVMSDEDMESDPPF